ncbi:adenine phosphoribosyltransferase [Qipengyuania psychrotolerans]|uniref:Adenine phosphoribosyltransferase n=1 Tax=Qipengyuania psychrotolerans TaxID=2867238 RepID=A0ABX8ZLQ1_9SPHN|nr:adenine phosphoribosyltransferase [Qipengyuania psychrotolerans]QZD88604.1 adenine phosphoribosyltransferase [Qipengyuania psychrotolerans]
MTPDELKSLVRTIPDFPKSGIQFRDITTLIGHGEGFRASVAWLADRVSQSGADAIAGMEARGFIFGAAVASALTLPFIPIRKPGKLPIETIGVDYALEYGSDRLEMDPGCIAAGTTVAIVDDLLATGGTACAATELLRKAGARVETATFVIDLPDLGGGTRLEGCDVRVDALMQFEGD